MESSDTKKKVTRKKTEERPPTKALTAMEEQKVVAVVDKVRKKRAKRDSKILIRAIMESPLRKGEVFEVDGDTPIEVVAKQNTDVQTRMLLKIAGLAAQGDIKAADFLMKYGGYTPPVEQNVTLNIPRIVDDISELEEDDEDE